MSSCARCAYKTPAWLYIVLFTLLNLALMGGGGYVIKLGIDALASNAADFVGRALIYMAFAGGASMTIIGLYGIVGPYCCLGKAEDHVKFYVVFATLLMLMVAVTVLVTKLNSDDQTGITESLDFGWQHHYKSQARHPTLSKAQTAHNCCGFGAQKDRKVDPCPSGASRGCEFRLREEYTKHLRLMFKFEAMGAGGYLVCIIVGYFYAQHLDMVANSVAYGGFKRQA